MISLILIFWLIVFCGPTFVTLYQKWISKHEISKKRATFNLCWMIGGAVLISIIVRVLFVFVDYWWFDDLGQADRFWTEWWTKWLLFFVGTILPFLFLYVNIKFAKKGIELARPETKGKHGLYIVAVAIAIGTSLLTGFILRAYWTEWLLWLNPQAFNIKDPVFNNDLSLYIFKLPMLELFRNLWLLILIVTTGILCGLYAAVTEQNVNSMRGEDQYDRNYNRRRREPAQDVKPPKRKWTYYFDTHLSILGFVLAVWFLLYTKVGMYNLLYSPRGAVFGAGYTDIHVQLPAFQFFRIAIYLSMLLFVISAIARSERITRWMCWSALGLCCSVWLIGVQIIPAAYQAIVVAGREISYEEQYIKYDMQFTKKAYGISEDIVTRVSYPVNQTVSPEILEKDKATLENIRLMDPDTLLAVNNQQQILGPYYHFEDVDVIRLNVKGKQTQMYVSLRELDQNLLAKGAKTWQNKNFIYTHGFGLSVAPVNQFNSEGLPEYILKDIPPETQIEELKTNPPRNYFSEKTDTDVIVNGNLKEYDYPLGGGAMAENSYTGTTGIRLGSFRRMVFSVVFNDLRLLTTQDITESTKVLMRREIKHRLKTLAPFLEYDADPYPSISNRDIFFVSDGYTQSEYYPYSQPVGSLNYIRNSVKAIVNIGSGTVDFYVCDPNDPIIKAYIQLFPKMFKNMDLMPTDLRLTLRVPEDMFTIQSKIFAMYHMNDWRVFYRKEDAWAPVKTWTKKGEDVASPSYIVMVLPNESKEEFVLMNYFSPISTDTKNPRLNMVGWLAVRCDSPNYGKLVCYEFGKNQLVYGPLQIRARINQNSELSKEITLWGQMGSGVHWPKPIVVPLKEHRILYVQPLYIQALVGRMPEMKRVILAMGDKLVYAPTLDEALEQLCGLSSAASYKEKVRSVANLLEQYRQLTGKGKFSDAGKSMDELNKILNDLLR